MLDWEPLPGPNCLRETNYGLRYLRMLVACATSVLRLDGSKILPLFAAANTTIISLAATAHDTDHEFRSVVGAITHEMETERDARADSGWLLQSGSRSVRICI